MEYTEQEFNEIFLAENKYTQHIPAYIREYPKFCRLLIIFSNYLKLAVDSIEKISSQLNLNTARGSVLETIAKRLDIDIEKPITNGVVDQDLYERMLKIAILGNGLKRNSKADRNSLSKITSIFNDIIKCEIGDKGISTISQLPMYINIGITGTTTTWSTQMLEKYVLPQITGVRMIVNYMLNNDNYFGFDSDTVVNIVTSVINTTAEIESDVNILYNAVQGQELVTGLAVRDADNNVWVYLQQSQGWGNSGSNTVNGDIVVDPELGYSLQGWDKGKWSPTTILK